MIHDATGKFSSRWVFPDRSSLALVIKILAAFILAWGTRRNGRRIRKGSRAPYREYAAKTNAMGTAPRQRGLSQPAEVSRRSCADADLLPVALQHLIAGGADTCGRFCCRQARIVKSPWSITARQWRCTSRLQACLLIRRARCAALLLGEGIRTRTVSRQQGESQESICASYSFIFDGRQSCSRTCAWASTGDGFVGIAGAA